MDRGKYTIDLFGKEQSSAFQSGRVLVVGAGGIGCEVLKNLVMCCVQDIHIVDLDTIDVSNLNRQFLFRPAHVGMSKALVAAEVAKLFNPSVSITAYHGNIKDSKFDVDFFSSFNLVLGALDNVDARRHVNRMCLAAGRILLESGTTGYLGQVVPIQKGVSECYECSAKPMQKVYPICTIRSTPDKPVHCIVWAKELFKFLFGNAKDSMLAEASSDAEGNDVSSSSSDRAPVPEKAIGEMSENELMEFVVSVIRYYFISDIEKKVAAGMYKAASVQPSPLSTELLTNLQLDEAASHSSADGWERSVWSPRANVAIMLACMVEGLRMRAEKGIIQEFDKDSKFAMKFVTASSNLRAATFSIPMTSYYDAKGIAGNIIPAISSTNAIIAGIQVSQAILILKDQSSSIAGKLPMVFCQRNPNRLGVYLQPMSLDPPKPTCYVCNKSQLTLMIDTANATLQELITKIVKARLGFVEPSLSIGSSMIYEEGEDAEDFGKFLSRKLKDCPAGGINNGTILTIEDFRQELNITIVTKHVDSESEELDKEKYPEGYRIEGYLESSKAPTLNDGDVSKIIGTAVSSEGGPNGNEGEDDVVFVSEPPAAAAANGNNTSGCGHEGDIIVVLDDVAPNGAEMNNNNSADIKQPKKKQRTI